MACGINLLFLFADVVARSKRYLRSTCALVEMQRFSKQGVTSIFSVTRYISHQWIRSYTHHHDGPITVLRPARAGPSEATAAGRQSGRLTHDSLAARARSPDMCDNMAGCDDCLREHPCDYMKQQQWSIAVQQILDKASRKLRIRTRHSYPIANGSVNERPASSV